MPITVPDSRRTFGGRFYELVQSDLYFHKLDSDMIHVWVNAAEVSLA
jgi:hypothetical protein